MKWMLFVCLVGALDVHCEELLLMKEDSRLSQPGYHLCTRTERRTVSYTVQYLVPFIVARPCGGWIPLKTCHITKYRMTKYTEYKTVTEQVTRCCEGYVQVGKYCALTVNRSRELTAKPGGCPADGLHGGHGCEWDIGCPGMQRCCQRSTSFVCTDPTDDAYLAHGLSQFNATVTVKVDYKDLMSREGGLQNHTRLLYAVVMGALKSNISIFYLGSEPVYPYRTATSLLIRCALSRSDVTFMLHPLLRLVQEVSSVTVDDIDECAQPFLHRCSPHADCVNTVGSYRCTCRPGYADVDPSEPGADCTALSTAPPQVTHVPSMTTTSSSSSMTPQSNTNTTLSDTTYRPPTAHTSSTTCPRPGVTDLRAANVTATSFRLHWSSRFPGNHTYRVVVSHRAEVVFVNDSGQKTAEVSGLDAGEVYEVRVTPFACGRQGNESRLNIKTDAQTLNATARLTNVNYTTDLQNASSASYLNLAAGIYMEIYRSLSPEMKALVDSGRVRIHITGFAPGSVVVNFALVFVLSQSENINDVSSALMSSLMNISKYDVDANNTGISDRDECVSGENDCSPSATCINTWGSYACVCSVGFVDDDPERPGRSCPAKTNTALGTAAPKTSIPADKQTVLASSSDAAQSTTQLTVTPTAEPARTTDPSNAMTTAPVVITTTPLTTTPASSTTSPAAIATVASTTTAYTPTSSTDTTTTAPAAVTTTSAAVTTAPATVTATPAVLTNAPAAVTTAPAAVTTAPAAVTTTSAAVTTDPAALTVTPAAQMTPNDALTTTVAASTTTPVALTTTPDTTTTPSSAMRTTATTLTTTYKPTMSVKTTVTTPASSTTSAAAIATVASTTTAYTSISSTDTTTTAPAAVTTDPAALTVTLAAQMTSTDDLTTTVAASTTTPVALTTPPDTTTTPSSAMTTIATTLTNTYKPTMSIDTTIITTATSTTTPAASTTTPAASTITPVASTTPPDTTMSPSSAMTTKSTTLKTTYKPTMSTNTTKTPVAMTTAPDTIVTPSSATTTTTATTLTTPYKPTISINTTIITSATLTTTPVALTTTPDTTMSSTSAMTTKTTTLTTTYKPTTSINKTITPTSASTTASDTTMSRSSATTTTLTTTSPALTMTTGTTTTTSASSVATTASTTITTTAATATTVTTTPPPPSASTAASTSSPTAEASSPAATAQASVTEATTDTTASGVFPSVVITTKISASGAIAVQCNVASITVTVARDFLQSSHIPAAALYLGMVGCGVNGGNATHVQLTADWDECHLQLKQNDSHYMASVTLSNSINSSTQAPKVQLKIPVMCTYERNMLVTSGFGSVGYSMIKDVIAGSGMFQVIMQLTNGSVPLPHNISLSRSEAVVVVFSLNTSVDKIKLVINKCWATPSLDPSLVSSRVFLENRCSLNSYTTVIANGNSSTSSLSVQIFSFVDFRVVYLHCQVQICVEMGSASCVHDCLQRTSRSGSSNTLEAALYSTGPLFSLDEGVFDEGLDTVTVIGLSCLGVGLAIFFAVGFICLFYCHRNRIGHYNFNINNKPREETFTDLTSST